MARTPNIWYYLTLSIGSTVTSSIEQRVKEFVRENFWTNEEVAELLNWVVDNPNVQNDIDSYYWTTLVGNK